MSKDLKHFLKKIFAKDAHEKLAVADAKLGQAIKSKLEIDCVADSSISELMRCVFITKNFGKHFSVNSNYREGVATKIFVSILLSKNIKSLFERSL